MGFFLIFLAAALSCSTLSSNSAARIPITKRGKMSTVVLALVERQNYIFDGTQTFVHPDGLVFYFIIYPQDHTEAYPSIRQYQNFTINGEPYWQNASGTYDSHTIIYNEKLFEEQESAAFAKISIRKNSAALIQKTVICGAPLPARGLILYPLFFGFNQNLEEFEFRFRIQDIKKNID
jgi:hypothetical protein